MVEFVFILDSVISVESFSLYWKSKTRTKKFAYTILCVIDGEWQIVVQVPKRVFTLHETMCPGIYENLIQIPKNNRKHSDTWKLITTLSEWSVIRYLDGTGYGTTCSARKV